MQAITRSLSDGLGAILGALPTLTGGLIIPVVGFVIAKMGREAGEFRRSSSTAAAFSAPGATARGITDAAEQDVHAAPNGRPT